MNRLRLIMPVSRDLQQFMERAGFRGPYEVIPNTVDTALFHPVSSKHRVPQKPVTILNVAMLQPIKGQSYLLEAMASLKTREMNCRLWMVGNGPEYQRLREQTDKLHIASDVSFLGVRTKSEVAELMRAADLFALTSLWENQPVALIEAMASGLPVIAPAIGGIPEIVKPEDGVLFEAGNVDDLVEKLATMIDHLDRYSSAESAKYAVETFGLTAVGQKFADIYEKILH